MHRGNEDRQEIRFASAVVKPFAAALGEVAGGERVERDLVKKTGESRVAIVADDREQSSGIPGILAALDGVRVRIDRLRAGDYLVAGRVLQSLPGIGRARAEGLLAEFGSVAKCLGADAEAWRRVPDIGSKTALAIERVLGE